MGHRIMGHLKHEEKKIEGEKKIDKTAEQPLIFC